MSSPTRDPRRRPSMDSTGSTRRARRSPSPVPGPSSRPERRHSIVSDTWVKSPPLSAASSSFPPPISATSTSFMSPPPPPPNEAQSPPPPPPPPPSALVPIPPLPDPPKFGLKQSKLSNDESKKIWEQRIGILATHDKLRKSIMARGERIKALERVYNNLPPSNNTASELERLKKEQDDESADFKKIFTKIEECDSWPMAPRPEQGIVENKFTDMMKQVDGMTKNISRLNISVKKKQEELSGPEETPTVTSRKRRRLSDGALDDSTFNVAELQESIDSAENQLLDLQNQLLNHDNDIQTEVTGQMENRYDELEAARSAGTDPEALFRQSASIRLHTAEQQLAEVAVEMADVINRETGKDEDHEQVKRQNAALVSEIHRLRAQFDTLESREAETNRQIAAISAAIHDYKTYPVVPPVPIAPEYLRPHVESVVLPEIRKTVRSMIDKMRADFQQTMIEKEQEIYGTVWDKLKLANSISETVVARMEAPPSASSVPVSK